MPFRVSVHLLEPSYQAAGADKSRAEWPPHPSRLFCGLVSVADPADPVQDVALRWLEEQSAPRVRVPARTAEAEEPRRSWVVTNTVGKRPSHAVLPGRMSSGMRQWPQRALEQPLVEFEWATEPPAGVAAVLEMLAKANPYIGRATGHALVHAQVVDEPLTVDDSGRWQVWAPAPDGASAWETVSLRVPYPGYLERLRQAYEEGQPAWQQSRSVPYVPEKPAGVEESEDASVEPVPGPWRDLVTFAFAQGVSLDPSLTLQVGEALRREVLTRLKWCGHDVKPMVAVHGHKEAGDERRLCAYLGLPFVGHRHADGRLRGVGVVLPHDLPAGHRRALVAALVHVEGGVRKLEVPTLPEPVALEYVGPGAAEVKRLESVRSRRWVGPSQWWTTALPMVLDHFPGRNGRGIEESVAKSCRLAGLPEPAEVQVLRTGAYLPGAPLLPAAALRRKKGEPPLPGRHVRVRFAQPVTGPVVIGSKRNFGLGLCMPTGPWTDQEGASA
ncbi:type I-U CRISPR-associated protein Csb2 [Streptomyces sp. NPDC004296]|uniref:type I-G CRISPR-associated protein Csb2 n=1 Tax=Streptomyces sp. NPDC004296 TaxID=3364697 RepID=UPI0036B0AF32